MKKFVAAFLSRIVAACSTLFFSIFVARALGPDNTGIFYFCLTWLIGLSLIARLGQEVNIVWYASRARHDQNYSRLNGLLVLSTVLTLLTSIFLASLTWVLRSPLTAWLQSEALAEALTLLILALPAMSLASIFAGCLKGVGRTGKSALLEQGGVFLLSSFMLLLWQAVDREISLSVVLLFFVACSYLTTIVAAWWWFSEIPLHWRRLSILWPEMPRFLRSSMNMGFVSFLTFAMQSGPLLLLGIFSDQRQVGLYAVGDRLVMVQYFIFSIVLVAAAQKLSTLFYQRKLNEFQRAANRSALVSTLGALPVAVFILIFPTWALLLFGHGFEGAELLVRLLCLAHLTSVFLGGGGYLLMIAGHESTLRNIQVISALFLLVLDILLIPFFGALGAAFAALLVYSFRYLAINYTMKRLLGFYIIPRW